MMRLLPFLLCAALASGEVQFANAPSPEAAPVLRESDTFRAVITLHNPYPRAIRIARLDSTCVCSKLELSSHFLIPGEAATLTVEAANLRRSGAQKTRVSLFLSDPDLEPIEAWCWWTVREAVAVDAIPPGTPALDRPADPAWRDIYRFIADERPDEPQRLRKRIRLSSPPEETPPGGLRVEGIDYAGSLWAFAQRTLENGAVVITATARDQQGPLPQGEFEEIVTLRTNHPDKPRIDLHFGVRISTTPSANPRDALGGGLPPPPLPPGGPPPR